MSGVAVDVYLCQHTADYQFFAIDRLCRKSDPPQEAVADRVLYHL